MLGSVELGRVAEGAQSLCIPTYSKFQWLEPKKRTLASLWKADASNETV